MDGMFLKPVTLALQDSRDKLIEAIKHRSGEEKWHLMNLSNKNNLNKLISEFNDLGLTSVHVYTRGIITFVYLLIFSYEYGCLFVMEKIISFFRRLLARINIKHCCFYKISHDSFRRLHEIIFFSFISCYRRRPV